MPQVKPLLNDLNWNLFRSFCAIAEEKSITRAAKRLNMSQPSVSLALQRLEEQLGCQLVFRDSRHFALTLRGMSAPGRRLTALTSPGCPEKGDQVTPTTPGTQS